MAYEREWQKQLEASLKRVQDALAKDARPHAQLLQAVLAAASAHALEKINEGVERGERRRIARALRVREQVERQRRKRDRDARAAVPAGFVFSAFAAVALYFALGQPNLWWMVFVSFGFAISAAGIFGSALAARRERTLPAGRADDLQPDASPDKSQAQRSSPVAQRLARVDAVCEKILAALANGSPAVREVVHRPEETLKALSATCKELGRREEELVAALADEDERRLRAEREELSARVAGESDAVVRQRLEAALRALDGQLAQRAELRTSASRLEAESTRILYTLEGVYAQVLRARSADAASVDVAGAGLRRSLEQLGDQIDAVASALEMAHGDLVQPVQPVESGPESRAPSGAMKEPPDRA